VQEAKAHEGLLSQLLWYGIGGLVAGYQQRHLEAVGAGDQGPRRAIEPVGMVWYMWFSSWVPTETLGGCWCRRPRPTKGYRDSWYGMVWYGIVFSQ
jgi:hypothetical protein